ncbi:flagellar export chaperone FliS [Pseudomonas parafulva]|uniref:flagellar export chaperone FliS n=1 Tax=Pseudomonas parafulva TaxID=157782 RepID=UPI0007348490|nr:flagellar export chaperone FliS [Pseudomonas parafulva]KTS91999.1 flagellar biosynthesis protein FliS [Pseudomonas parafulva]
MHPMRALRQYQKVNSHAQISEATPHRLVQLLMEGALDRMAQAKGAISRGDVAQKGVMLGKAVDIIGGLREGLDKDKAVDPDELDRLDSLYEYMARRLTQANIHSDPEVIDEVARLMITVKSGWDAIAMPSNNPSARSPL